MIRFLADEDFDNRIVRGRQRRLPALDLVLIAEYSLEGEYQNRIVFLPLT